MSERPDRFTSAVEFTVDKQGNPIIYISDVLADTDPASATALAWAHDAVENDEDEHYMLLSLDIPTSVQETLDNFNEGTAENIIISTEHKQRLAILKAQLEEALKIFDRVTWIE